MAVIGAPAYCVMFGPGPPGPQQTAARERFRRTTLAYMGCRSLQAAAKEMGIRFVGAHTRAIYSRLVTGDPGTLTTGEAQSAFAWGDWAALAPQFWVGGRRVAGTAERDMMYDPSLMRDWPYRYIAAMASIYGWDALTSTGIFLDADVLEWWQPLRRVAAVAKAEGVKVYLNGGRFREMRNIECLEFDGLFYEAVHVGRPYEASSRQNAEALLARFAEHKPFWVGIQVRFRQEPTEAELTAWSDWFLRARRNASQSVTFVVQPEGQSPRELHCPDALDPARQVQATPAGRPLEGAAAEAEMESAPPPEAGE